jgi:hypothetical protein
VSEFSPVTKPIALSGVLVSHPLKKIANVKSIIKIEFFIVIV